MKVVNIILLVIALSYGDCGDLDSRIRLGSSYKKHFKRVRCTRRYTPGSCLESVKTVWSYVPHKQSCAERLGCPADLFANRFNSAEHCNETCRELIYLYMFLQEAEKGNFTIPDLGDDEEEDLEPPDENIHRIYEDYGTVYNDYQRGSNAELNFEEDNDASSDQSMDRRYNKYGDRPPVPDSEDATALREHMLPDIDNF